MTDFGSEGWAGIFHYEKFLFSCRAKRYLLSTERCTKNGRNKPRPKATSLLLFNPLIVLLNASLRWAGSLQWCKFPNQLKILTDKASAVSVERALALKATQFLSADSSIKQPTESNNTSRVHIQRSSLAIWSGKCIFIFYDFPHNSYSIHSPSAPALRFARERRREERKKWNFHIAEKFFILILPRDQSRSFW